MAAHVDLSFVRLFCLCIIFFSPDRGDAFNVDVNAPLVKLGTRNSYFGFSTAVHRIDSSAENVILVGAPRHNRTGYTQPGSVFRCPLTSRVDDCQEIPIDYGDDRNKDKFANQWMGVSIASQSIKLPNSKAIACGHRYKEIRNPNDPRNVQYFGYGYCMPFDNDLVDQEAIVPCDGKPAQAGAGNEVTMQYALCQAGASIAVNDDNNILFGAPGTGVWRGALAKVDFASDKLDDESASKWHWTLSDDILRDGEKIASERVTGFYSYLGMSAKFGRLLDGYNTTLVGGSPRSKSHGQVIFFVMNNSREELIAKQYLNGEQIGSGFGYVFAIGDFNGDGKDDIVVGAPFYFRPGVSGAIYVYINGPAGIDERIRHRIDSRTMTPDECKRMSCLDTRFGFALANVGDLDKDGCQDLVVGAPYEGQGAVYIYRGSKHQSASSVFQLSQRIYASDVRRATGMRSFGYSFADTRGVDIDGGEYPDFIVGSYAADTVVVLRTRPVVNVETSIRSHPERLNPSTTTCASDGTSYNCFNVTACFKFTAEPKNRFNSTLKLQYRIVAEVFGVTQVSRVFFQSRQSTSDNYIVVGNVSLYEQWRKQDVCVTEKVYVNKNNNDFLRSIGFQLTYDLVVPPVPIQVTGQYLVDLNTYPIMVPVARPPTLQVPFVKNCGDDEQCTSQLSLDVGVTNLRPNDKGRYELNIASIEGAAELNMNISVVNNGEDAHAATLTVQLPSSVVYTGSDSEAKRYSCTAISLDNTVVCSLGNPLVPDKRISLQLMLSPDLDALSSEDFSRIVIFVNTTSTETNTSDDTRFIDVEVIYETDVAVLGSTDPETVIITNEILETLPRTGAAIGPEVLHTYEVRNLGPIKITQFAVEISWPFRWGSSNYDYLLYLVEEPETTDGLSECKYDRSIVDPLKLTKTKNDAEVDGPSRANLQSTESRSRRSVSAHVDCENREVECKKINCLITSLEPKEGAVIKLFARLWNRTISQEFQYEEEVRVSSSARLVIENKLNFRESNPANDFIKVTTTVLFEGVRSGLKIWHIVLAILIGLLALAAFIFLLWKCDFFKRNKHAQQVHYRAEVNRQRDEDDESPMTAEDAEKFAKTD